MIILASKSPRRKELLSLCGFEFEIIPTDVDETLPEGITPPEAVEYLSKIKAEPLRDENNIVIGSDTVVALGNEILGKPGNSSEAVEMLRKLSGNSHFVYTGVTIMKGNKEVTFHEKTEVKFYELSEKEIEEYVACGECWDKAGSYGIQGFGGLLIEKINGDYNNVVGLPVARLIREYKKMTGEN